MKQFKIKINTPIWYVMIVAIVLTALILYGIIYPGIQYTRGIFLDSSLYGNPNVLGKIQPNRSYADSWNEIDIISAFFCLFMGFVCFILGVARSINRLGGKQIYMLAVFLGLFAVNTLSLIKISAVYVDQTILFYTYWTTYFTYPIVLFIHLYSYFDEELKMWICPLLAIPIVYSASAMVAHITCGFPYEIFGKPYNPITVVCLIIILLTGLFKVKQKPILWFIRTVSGFWIGWACYVVIKMLLRLEGYLHNEYKSGITVTAVLIVCYIIFINARELFSYKYDLQILSLQNQSVLENYEQTKTYIRQISSIKHEVNNHLNAMQILLINKRFEEATDYLKRYTEQVNTVNDVVYYENILINAIIGTLIYKAKELDIRVELDLKASPIHIADIDLFSLFSNIINNALESCKLMPEGTKRLIKLAITKKEPYFNIDLRNSMIGEPIRVNGQLQTTKQGNGHGYGLNIIKQIVHTYDGIVDIDYSENMFRIMISLKDSGI